MATIDGFIRGIQQPMYNGIDVSSAAPVASFSSSKSNYDVTFTDTSTDADGRIVSWAWNFGDSSTSTSQNPVHTYAAAGSYTVTLTVTDNTGRTHNVSNNVTLTRTDITWVSMSNSGSTTDATSFTISGYTALTANRLVLLVVQSAVTTGTGNTPTASGGGLTWVAITNQVQGIRRTTIFRAMGTPNQGTITVDFAGQSQSSWIWTLAEATGADVSGTNGSGAIVQSGGTTSAAAGTTITTATLSAFENAKNHNFTALGLAAGNITPDANFTELTDGPVQATVAIGGGTLYGINRTSGTHTISNTAVTSVSVEVKAGVS